MVKAKSRAAIKRIKDKWKAKSWYRVLAPSMFDEAPIAETLAADKNLLIGRVTEISLQDLTGDFRKSHIKLYFKIDEVEGSDAHTYFYGHTLTTDYVRRLIRRRRSRIDGVYDVNTKDGALIRLKPFATTERRIQTSQKHEIRKIMKDTVISYAKDRTLSELIKGILNEELSKEISKNCKKFYPLRKVEVYKSELLKRPTLKMEEPKKKKEAEKTEESKEEKPKPKEEKTEEKEVIEKEKPKEEKIKKKPKKTAKKTNKKENKKTVKKSTKKSE